MISEVFQFFLASTAGVPVSGPWCIEAAQLYVPGANETRAEVYSAGAVKGETYAAGAAAGEVSCSP